MHHKHLISAADALQKVFIPFPTLQYSLHTPLLPFTLRTFTLHDRRRHIGYRAFNPATDNQPQLRTTPPRPSHYGPPPNQRGPVRDEAIQANAVHLVSEDGSLTTPHSLISVLSSLNREKQFLTQVAINGQSELPICKIQDKVTAREAARAKDKAAKAAAAKKDKQLEIGWGIGPNDLGHRLNKMKDFVAQGRRVEINVGMKRRAREVGPDQMVALLKTIKKRIDRDGAKEWKEMEGKVGDMVTFFVEPRTKT